MAETRFETLEKLKGISTATLTTSLFKRGFKNLFIQDVHRVTPGPNMVGIAYTLRTIPAREDLDHLGSFETRANAQRKAIEECPAGAVFVVDSRDDPAASSMGGILAMRLQVLGAAGIVTDGGVRDTPDVAQMAIHCYQRRPGVPTNLARHHPVGINEPIACGGVPVYPGDVMVGDNEGVGCIPAHLADEVARRVPK